MLWPCVCLCLSQVEWLNVGSRKQYHTIGPSTGTVVSDAKDLREIRPGSPGLPQRWRQTQVGWVKVSEFRQITHYYLKKRYKREAQFLLKLKSQGPAFKPQCNRPIINVL